MYRYEALADKIIQDILREAKHVIGVTGTSCIGKSTFTKLLKSRLQPEYVVTVINVDSYLKKDIQGGTKFWNRCCEYLKPEHFDWKTLAQDVETLRLGREIEIQAYVRGVGWNNTEILKPAEILILEGLFLDSVEAAEAIKYDIMIA